MSHSVQLLAKDSCDHHIYEMAREKSQLNDVVLEEGKFSKKTTATTKKKATTKGSDDEELKDEEEEDMKDDNMMGEVLTHLFNADGEFVEQKKEYTGKDSDESGEGGDDDSDDDDDDKKKVKKPAPKKPRTRKAELDTGLITNTTSRQAKVKAEARLTNKPTTTTTTTTTKKAAAKAAPKKKAAPKGKAAATKKTTKTATTKKAAATKKVETINVESDSDERLSVSDESEEKAAPQKSTKVVLRIEKQKPVEVSISDEDERLSVSDGSN